MMDDVANPLSKLAKEKKTVSSDKTWMFLVFDRPVGSKLSMIEN